MTCWPGCWRSRQPDVAVPGLPRQLGRAVALLLAIAPLLACSPALNWRQMDLAEADGLRLSWPCKPDRIERTLRLDGLDAPLRMVMWSCEAAGATWVLSAARLGSATDVAPALRAWSAATEGNLVWADRRARQQAPGPTQPAWQRADAGVVQVPGMTPNPDARGWRTQGLKPDGTSGATSLSVDAWHFSHGLTVLQAAVWRGERPLPRENGEDAVEVFHRSLHFPG
jgi:hypothetical protein